MTLDPILHSQRRVAGPDGVVLVGEGRAEQGHDAVAHDLVHRALVVMDGLEHQLQDGVENLACLFGILVGQQLHRAFEIGEEHGDLLALAFERRPRREDLLGEVPRRVGVGRDKAAVGQLRGHRGLAPALRAELRRRGELDATGHAGPPEGGAALLTELRGRSIVVQTVQTLH